MNYRGLRLAGFIIALSALLLLGACHKKTAAVQPPPTPPTPVQPTATLSATPGNVERGQSVQLSWSTQNATDVSIDAFGTVPASGNRSVTPSDS